MDEAPTASAPDVAPPPSPPSPPSPTPDSTGPSEPLSDAAEHCPVTWADLRRLESSRRSCGGMLLVCVYFGVFGAHRFVMGRPLGLVMLLTFVISVPLCFVLVGFLGVFSVYVWVIVDLLSIPRWVREHNAALLVRMRTESRIAAAR